MKSKYFFLPLLLMAITLLFGSCKKDTFTTSLYVPTNSDVTANATLQELEDGRTLYINNCGECHSLYSPDSYSVTKWKSIMNSMGQKTSMTSPQITLVTKYVCKGQQ